MPIWLRNFTYSKLKEHYSSKDQDNTKADHKQITGPDIKPSYSTKVSK